MDRYPQETLGCTLLQIEHEGEYRRVYIHERAHYTEVGELTHGPLTLAAYGAEVHHHAVHFAKQVPPGLAAFFATGEPLLSDLMDKLDARGIDYAYLDTLVGSHVAYRPHSRRISARGG